MDNEDFDLNSLRTLDVLLQERHVSRSAERLGVSQPAVSRALARLRDQLGDELLVRGPSGLVLTDRARSLIEPVSFILRQVSELQHPPELQPDRLTDRFTIAGLDFELQVFLPRLLKRLRREAPHASLRALQFASGDFGMLDNNAADVVMTAFPSSSDRYRRRVLYTNQLHCVMGARTARQFSSGLSLQQFIDLPHGLVSFETHGEGQVDPALRALGLSRRIVLRIPGFLLVPEICATSDVVFTLPSRMAVAYPRTPRLTWLPCPVEIPATTTYLYWHPRQHQNPAQQWFRTLVFDCVAEIERGQNPG